MDRRAFLRAGTAGASGLFISGVSSCAWFPKVRVGPPPEAPLPDMNAYLSRIDAGMERIAQWSPTSAVPYHGGDGAALDELGQKALQTLYMTGMFSDLPIKGQLHPGMQDRIWTMMPDMDVATSGMEQYLASRSPEELARVQLALRSPSNPGMTIVEGIDESAALCGVSRSRRLQTRVLMTEAVWRLRNQPPTLAIHDSIQRVQRASAANVNQTARQDWIAARVGEKVFWELQAQGGTSGSSSAQTSDEKQTLRQKRISRAATIMGIGIVVGGIAVGITAAGFFPAVFGATVGAVMILVGLIMMIVGVATPGDKPAD